MVSSLIVMTTAQLGSAILVEAALSFLGLGAPEPYPSWGRMLSVSAAEFAQRAPWGCHLSRAWRSVWSCSPATWWEMPCGTSSIHASESEASPGSAPRSQRAVAGAGPQPFSGPCSP